MQIKTIRKRRGLNLREMALQTGVSAPTLSRIERGHLPTGQVIRKLVRWARREGLHLTAPWA